MCVSGQDQGAGGGRKAYTGRLAHQHPGVCLACLDIPQQLLGVCVCVVDDYITSIQ